MAANDADDAYVMDLSERHLSSRGLHDALAGLQRVLHDEDERDGVTIARPLELLCAGNDVAKFALPASELGRRGQNPGCATAAPARTGAADGRVLRGIT